NPVGGNDVEYVQPLYCGSRQGIVSVFVRLGSRDVGVSLLKREKVTELEILYIAVAVTAYRRERDRSLNINGLVKRSCDVTAESVRASVVVKRTRGPGHGYHLV